MLFEGLGEKKLRKLNGKPPLGEIFTIHISSKDLRSEYIYIFLNLNLNKSAGYRKHEGYRKKLSNTRRNIHQNQNLRHSTGQLTQLCNQVNSIQKMVGYDQLKESVGKWI